MEVKTPLIIKEALGEEIYNMFEEYRKKYPRTEEDYKVKIWTSERGRKLFEEAVTEEYERYNTRRD